jgi:hypothetical protein
LEVGGFNRFRTLEPPPFIVEEGSMQGSSSALLPAVASEVARVRGFLAAALEQVRDG